MELIVQGAAYKPLVDRISGITGIIDGELFSEIPDYKTRGRNLVKLKMHLFKFTCSLRNIVGIITYIKVI